MFALCLPDILSDMFTISVHSIHTTISLFVSSLTFFFGVWREWCMLYTSVLWRKFVICDLAYIKYKNGLYKLKNDFKMCWLCWLCLKSLLYNFTKVRLHFTPFFTEDALTCHSCNINDGWIHPTSTWLEGQPATVTENTCVCVPLIVVQLWY